MNNYIAHHGILGQKWGVRRFQNADGSRTSAGKSRYEKADKKSGWKEKYEARKYKYFDKDGHITEAGKKKYHTRIDKKNVEDMDDNELKAYNNRLNAEQNAKRNDENRFGKNLTTAAKIAAGVTAVTGALIAINNLSNQANTFFKGPVGQKVLDAGKKAVTAGMMDNSDWFVD